MQIVKKIEFEFKKIKNSSKAQQLSRFFKTGPGEYAEGDIFYGITVPETRKLVQKYQKLLTRQDVAQLIKSPVHEIRLFALLIVINLYKHADEHEKSLLYQLYLSHTQYINNWDLVDLSAEHIVGAYLADKSKQQLVILAKSKNLWERRIAMLSTFNYIKNGKAEDALIIAEILLDDNHDLIHKAVGWMLREVGKRINQQMTELFLEKHMSHMSRTTLRYAIERFPNEKKAYYMKSKTSI